MTVYWSGGGGLPPDGLGGAPPPAWPFRGRPSVCPPTCGPTCAGL